MITGNTIDMKKLLSLVLVFMMLGIFVFAATPNKYKLIIAPGTLAENSVTLLWDKQYAKEAVVYEILLNNKLNGTATKTNYTVTDLLPGTTYKVIVRLKGSNDKRIIHSNLKPQLKENLQHI